MREIRPSGLAGGEAGLNRPSLPRSWGEEYTTDMLCLFLHPRDLAVKPFDNSTPSIGKQSIIVRLKHG